MKLRFTAVLFFSLALALLLTVAARPREAVTGTTILSGSTTAVYATYGHHDAVLLPDRAVTPGKVRTTDSAEVCHGGSTKQYRHTTAAEKAQVYKWYQAVKKPQICCEVDHLISLELGGADEVENLWPQPYKPPPGAHEKDAVENWLHAQVCAGSMTLGEAQAQIATDWYAVYLTMISQLKGTK